MNKTEQTEYEHTGASVAGTVLTKLNNWNLQ